MAETVFILGAGASRQGGAPLMSDFLDAADLLLRRGDVQESRSEFEMVASVLAKFQVVHSKSELDLTNIESAFAALEMARMLGRMPGAEGMEIAASISALKKVIFRTLEVTLRLPVRDGQAHPPVPYGDFISLIDHLRNRSHPSQRVAVLTFNYDLAVDYACLWRGFQVDYGLRAEALTNPIPVLKLHGSLNWGTCGECKEIVPWMLYDYLTTWDLSPSSVTLEVASKLTQKKHCNKPLLAEPLLVPPTWNKGEYHAALARVWARAAAELAEAENIFVCGYSLPETDSFFRFLYALGTVGDHMLKRLWVCDPDKSGAVRARFEALLGPGARRRFTYFEIPFNEAIVLIKGEFPSRETV
jgi:NAD-dependent SIR2 family protein deacetylase